MSLNAVIGFYSGYTSLDTEKGGLRVFVESFRKYNKNDLIIITLNLPIECNEMLDFCKKYNCIIEPVVLTDVKTGNRWIPYKLVLEKDKYSNLDKILIMDMNDAIFTGDPFLIDCGNKLYCAAEKTKYNIKNEDHNMNSMKINTNWMNSVSIISDNKRYSILHSWGLIDDKNLQEGKCYNYSEKCIYNKSIICSGTILGKKETIFKLLTWGNKLIGADQGILNIYVHIYNPSECIVKNLNESEILTMDSINFNEELLQDSNGYILNKNMKRYSICHQIDRGGHLHHFLKLGKIS